jgi:hypothetical protein
MIRIREIDHLVLRVVKLDAMLKFKRACKVVGPSCCEPDRVVVVVCLEIWI